MTQKIQISKVGINAGTATNPDDLTFSSDYNTLKYYTSGTINVTLVGGDDPGTDVEGTVTHNLGYTPFFIAFCNYYPLSTNYNMIPGFFADAGIYDHSLAYADANKLYFKVFTNSYADFTRTFRYFIFKNNTGL